jgi:hypothetical protein
MNYIYALGDPRNNEIYYIGKTSRAPNYRFKEHIEQAIKHNKSIKDKWILELLSKDIEPTLSILEITDDKNNIYKIEKTYIEKYINNKSPILNITHNNPDNIKHSINNHLEEIKLNEIKQLFDRGIPLDTIRDLYDEEYNFGELIRNEKKKYNTNYIKNINTLKELGKLLEKKVILSIIMSGERIYSIDHYVTLYNECISSIKEVIRYSI